MCLLNDSIRLAQSKKKCLGDVVGGGGCSITSVTVLITISTSFIVSRNENSYKTIHNLFHHSKDSNHNKVLEKLNELQQD